jgi:tetratricopeptide (TPR) repeat protein
MERKKYIPIIVGLVLFCAGDIYGQSPQKAIYDAYIESDMRKWRVIMLQFAETQSKNLEQKLELVGYYYGYTAWHIDNEKGKLASHYIAAAEALLDEILSQHGVDASLMATAHAYKGAFIGYKIGLYPLKAPFIGPKSIKHTERAFILDPQNIQAHIDFGNSLFYRPSILGGDKMSAIIHYKKAIKLFEAKKDTVDNWRYLNILSALGQAHESVDQFKQARSVYEKTLRIEPKFIWVRDELLPSLQQQSN